MAVAAVAGGAALAGIIAQMIAANEQANAQQNIANAQLGAAGSQRAAAIGAAMPTTQELEQISQQITLQNQAIDRQQKLLDAIDPTIIEAGNQALKLMRGQEASTLAPLRAERQRQRGDLLNKLRGQLGTGAETSTTGAEALNRFDTQTASLLSDKQTSTLNDLLKVGVSSRPNPYDATTANANTLQALNAPRNRLVNAINGNSVTPYAGAPFIGQAYGAAQTAGLGAGLTQAGTQLGTLALLQKPGATAATATTPGVGNAPMSDYQADFNPNYGKLA